MNTNAATTNKIGNYKKPTELERLQERVEYLETEIRNDDERYDELLQRYDRAFEELCRLLNISCWTGCQICFKDRRNTIGVK